MKQLYVKVGDRFRKRNNFFLKMYNVLPDGKVIFLSLNYHYEC